ncbi:MAG: methionyl-tRNA formyltransferase [Firmicutes bacterium]|nr:methionyl-tRNA formyltransferase [Bacillota bacterium]
MKIIFMGSPEFAVPHLEALISSGYNIPLVFTQPDRPRARGRRCIPTPVKELAEKCGIPVYSPGTLENKDCIYVLEGNKPDVIVVVAYGLLIPKEILDIPSKGCINVHASLLPVYRGAAPIERAIMAGEEVTGVTTMYMAEGWDTGDIILQKKVRISKDMTSGELGQVLSIEGASLLIKTLELIKSGTAPRIVQDERLATYAPKLTPCDFFIDWRKSAQSIHNLVRAGNPDPGAFTYLQGKRFKIFQGKVLTDVDNSLPMPKGLPGRISCSNPNGIVAETGKGFYIIQKVQCEGGKRLAVKDYLCGNPIQVGDVLGK